jgi:hypothetical protein
MKFPAHTTLKNYFHCRMEGLWLSRMEGEDELFHFVELISPGADWLSPIWPRRCMISPKAKVQQRPG